MSLDIKDLVLGYEDKKIVNNINLSIPKGKITILIGANGCGKSTLLSGMSRLLTPKEGSVLLDNISIHEYKPKELAKKLAILPQGPIAPEGITVKELCYFGRNPYKSIFGTRSQKDEEMVNWAIRATGLEDFENRQLDSLSGGQRQRAWIAMALTQDTDVLLLDEPTSALDPELVGEVEKSIADAAKSGQTMVLVSHDMSFVRQVADKVLFLEKGHILE